MAIKISKLLKPESILLDIASTNHADAIHQVAQLLTTSPQVTNFDAFYQEIMAREKVESTYLGNEIAFPHARTDAVKGMVLAVGRSQQGVWFENCSQTVKLIFVIGTPKKMVTDYLTVVGALARILKDKDTRDNLLEATSTEEFIQVITQAESKL